MEEVKFSILNYSNTYRGNGTVVKDETSFITRWQFEGQLGSKAYFLRKSQAVHDTHDSIRTANPISHSGI